MIRRCRETGLPEPEFSVSDGFVITLYRPVAGGPGEVLMQPESRPESQPESQPESLELRVLGLLERGPLGKAEISVRLGQKEVSGRLNQVIRLSLAEQTIEYTLPGKPHSRMQKYRLTEKGASQLTALRRSRES